MRTKTSAQADKILQAASHLFGAQRFHEVRMEDIASEAEVGKGTLYRYFNDKEELYLALLAHASEQFLAGVKKAIAQAQGARRRIEAVVSAIIAYFDEQPNFLDLIQRAEVLRPTGAPLPWQHTREEMVQLVGDLFAEGQASAEFVIGDPHLATLILLGGLRVVIRMGEQPRPHDLAHRIVSLFLSNAQGNAMPTEVSGWQGAHHD